MVPWMKTQLIAKKAESSIKRHHFFCFWYWSCYTHFPPLKWVLGVSKFEIGGVEELALCARENHHLILKEILLLSLLPYPNTLRRRNESNFTPYGSSPEDGVRKFSGGFDGTLKWAYTLLLFPILYRRTKLAFTTCDLMLMWTIRYRRNLDKHHIKLGLGLFMVQWPYLCPKFLGAS